MAQPEGTTPGPWSTERCTLETDLGGKWCGKSLIVGPHASDSRFAEADARLISAAPDLYAALQELIDKAEEFASSDPDMPSHKDTETAFEEAMRQGLAALRKADGEDKHKEGRIE